MNFKTNYMVRFFQKITSLDSHLLSSTKLSCHREHRIILSFILSFSYLISFSQDSLPTTGIQFITGLSWDQIRAKAKAENKSIFVDVYATWCGPCKVMDKDIYPLTEVGKQYNEKFISIKVQADKTPKDNEEIRNWYEDAEKLIDQYKIGAYPTFLFITSDGKLVHRASGVLNALNFMGLATDVLRQRGYTSLLEAFMKGQYENLNLKELAMSAKYAGDDSLAKAIATIYVQRIDIQELIKQDNMVFVNGFAEHDKEWAQKICMPRIKLLTIHELANPIAIRFLLYAVRNKTLVSQVTDHWISTMTQEALFTKETLEYLASFMCYSTDKSFALFYKNGKRINKIIGNKDWAQGRLDAIIINEAFYEPIYYPAVKLVHDGRNVSELTEPDWKKLHSNITTRYGAACARRLQFSPKIYWYKLIGNKKEYIKNLLAEMDRTRGWKLNGMALNNSAMEVFRYSTSKKELEKALGWMKKYFTKNSVEMETNAAGIDTYAILLYKSGRIKEAIMLEEKAVMINPSDVEISNNLSDMKKGLRIWPDGFNVMN